MESVVNCRNQHITWESRRCWAPGNPWTNFSLISSDAEPSILFSSSDLLDSFWVNLRSLPLLLFLCFFLSAGWSLVVDCHWHIWLISRGLELVEGVGVVRLFLAGEEDACGGWLELGSWVPDTNTRNSWAKHKKQLGQNGLKMRINNNRDWGKSIVAGPTNVSVLISRNRHFFLLWFE